MKRGTSGINALLAIDKPVGLSSHDVVGRVRRILGERRVGHAGTLDPSATGVLIIGVGQATRLLGLLTLERKSYLASIRFGMSTTTDDAEGDPISCVPVPNRVRDEEHARERLSALVGESMQVPPQFSAISVDGRRAYATARSGGHVQLDARPITVHSAQLVSIIPDEQPLWICSFDVSKGTYIRSIARDLGEEEGCGAHLAGLRRTSSGSIGIDRAFTLEELEASADGLERILLDPVAVLGYPVYVPDAEGIEHARVGRAIPLDESSATLVEGARCCLVHDGMLIGVWRRSGGSLVSEANFPEGILGANGYRK